MDPCLTTWQLTSARQVLRVREHQGGSCILFNNLIWEVRSGNLCCILFAKSIPQVRGGNYKGLVGIIMAPPKYVPSLLSRTCGYVTVHGKREFVDVIKFMGLKVQRLWISRWVQCNHTSL